MSEQSLVPRFICSSAATVLKEQRKGAVENVTVLKIRVGARWQTRVIRILVCLVNKDSG